MDYDTELLNLALDAGEIMLRSGAETFRVQDTMLRILSVTGREKIEALALSTMLIVTLPREVKGPLSMARGVKDRSINFEKICAVNALSRAFVSGQMTLDDATARIREIYNAPSYSRGLITLGYGLTSGGFSLIYSQSLSDGAAAFCIGLVLGLLMGWVGKRQAPYFFGSFLGGFVTGLLACLFHLLLPTSKTDMIVIGSIMPLLPGLTLTKATRDLLEGNFISGNSKMVEALLIACAIAGGAALSMGIFLTTT